MVKVSRERRECGLGHKVLGGRGLLKLVQRGVRGKDKGQGSFEGLKARKIGSVPRVESLGHVLRQGDGGVANDNAGGGTSKGSGVRNEVRRDG